MRERWSTPGAGTLPPLPRLLLSSMLMAALGVAGSAYAQSFLGDIRGTVVDPQGGVVPGATVLVTDENTGVPRTVETNAEGFFQASDLRPGTYRVEIITTSFKKYEATGVVLRGAGVARIDARLELGAITETVTVSAEAGDNITIDSQAIIRGLDAQQLRDLPRSSRDMQSFLLLNPNVVGGSDDIQFLGGRTYGVSYVQDGQASTNAIFGTIGNSAPALDILSEVQVLSNSYSAEYGGLAAVVVTTKRGGNAFHGLGFLDFNSDEMNALTYNQKLSGAERNDPNSDTHTYRWGFSLGGPIKTNKTFFYAAYEGSNTKAIYGGARGTVPTQAMRGGDFSAASFTINDPLTGAPFPGNIIPADRLDPAAQNIMNWAYPLPNQGTLSNGYGVYQQFVPENQKRHRLDLRFDWEASPKDSVMLRAGYQSRDPATVTFEAGNAFTNLGILDRVLTTSAFIGGWTRIFSPTVVNEFRVGYNFDRSNRESQYLANEVAAAWGIESAPSLDPTRVGFPTMDFSGSNNPADIRDAGRNRDRTIKQNSFSIGNNTTFILGKHSLKGGALWNRNSAEDGFGIGVNYVGLYDFSRAPSGNSFVDFMLGNLGRRVRDHITARGPLQGHSDDFAAFVQDDWQVGRDLTVFLGLRYEIVGMWNEQDDLIANFRPVDEGYHVVANEQVAALLPPAAQDLGLTRLASDVGLPNTLISSDRNNFSPRVGFAWRLGGDDKTVLRGGFGIFHPTVAVQGVRDLLATNEFRYYNNYVGGTLQHAYSGIPATYGSFDYGAQGLDPNLKSPDIYQYNLTLEREMGDFGARASYIGSTMRNLLTDSDMNMVYPNPNDWGWDPFDEGEVAARVPFPLHGWWMDYTQNLGEGQFNALQLELTRRYRGGLAFNAVYTYSHSDSTAPDSGNSSIGVVLYNPWEPLSDRGPDPNVIAHRFIFNGTWDLPVGKNRKYGSDMPGWADALFGGWTVSTLFQARSGMNLTPFFYGFYSSNDWGTGKPLDGLGNAFCCAWRPDELRDPSVGTRDQWFDQTAYGLPPNGEFGNATKGSLKGPGTWVMNFAFYKDVVATDRWRLQLTALLDNAFNHPQFFPYYGSDFHGMGDYFVDGILDNGVTGVLGADTIGNAEGFSPGRTFRLGIRLIY